MAGPILRGWTDADQRALEECAAKGMSAKQTSDAIGRSLNAVTIRASNTGVRFASNAVLAHQDALADMLRAGMTQDEAAAAVGLTKGAVSHRVKKSAELQAAYEAGAAVRKANATKRHKEALARYLAAKKPPAPKAPKQRKARAPKPRAAAANPMPVVIVERTTREVHRPVVGDWLSSFRPNPDVYRRLFPERAQLAW